MKKSPIHYALLLSDACEIRDWDSALEYADSYWLARADGGIEPYLDGILGDSFVKNELRYIDSQI